MLAGSSHDWFDVYEQVKLTTSITPIPQTIELVKSLKQQGYRVAMLSNVTESQADIIRKLGYYELFDPVVLSCDIKVEKPNEEAYKILLERLCLRPSECLFIDDQIKNVEAAQKLGIESIEYRIPNNLIENFTILAISKIIIEINI
jgi:epoxide hydrolase-like predicted phosphatase